MTIHLEMDANSATLSIEGFESFQTASRVAEMLLEALAPDGDVFSVIDVDAEWESYNMPAAPSVPQVMILFTRKLQISELLQLLKSIADILEVMKPNDPHRF